MKELFDACLSDDGYEGNQYIWKIFNAFIDHKDEIEIDMRHVDENCSNKALLDLVLSDVVKQQWLGDKYEEYSEDKYKTKNLLKREILTIFRNVTSLEIGCQEYPFSLDSLFSVINATQITTVKIAGMRWLPSLKAQPIFDGIVRKYKQSNFNLQFEYNDEYLTITHNE